MLSMHMDDAGANQLAKQLEVALAVEGVKAPEHAVRGAIASLLQLDNWANLQNQAKKQLLKLVYGVDPHDLLQKVMTTAVMQIAATVMEPVHPAQMSGVSPTDSEDTEAQPLLITIARNDPPKIRIHFNGSEISHNYGLFGDTSTLSSSDPDKLGQMLASILVQEIYHASGPIEDLVETGIDHDPETGEDQLSEAQGNSDWETCPHCRATTKFANYARINQLPVPDEQFPAMEMGEAGEFVVFAPYEDQELMFCMIEDDVLTWLPEGTILPMMWSTDLLDIISGMQGLPSIGIGDQVMILSGMILWPDDHFMSGTPATGTVRSFVSDEGDAQRAKIKVEGQRKLLTIPVDCLILR